MSPFNLNTMRYDAIFPPTSSDFNATITSSFVCGTNLNDENPRVKCSGPIRVAEICEKSSLTRNTRFVALCSSSCSVYASLLARRGRKNHCWCTSLHIADSWIMYPVCTQQADMYSVKLVWKSTKSLSLNFGSGSLHSLTRSFVSAMLSKFLIAFHPVVMLHVASDAHRFYPLRIVMRDNALTCRPFFAETSNPQSFIFHCRPLAFERCHKQHKKFHF